MKRKNGGVQSQKDALGRTLVKVAQCHNKAYCWATRETLCLLMAKYQNTNVSIRTLSRRLTEMHNEGFIIRQLRTMPDGNGGKRFTCNLYYLTKKLFLWVKKMGDFARKVFSFFREPTLAHYSSNKPRRDLEGVKGIVEILWKSPPKGWLKPSEAIL